jgi:hypothetical protein
MGLIHHADAEREWAYDVGSKIAELTLRSTRETRRAGRWWI